MNEIVVNKRSFYFCYFVYCVVVLVYILIKSCYYFYGRIHNIVEPMLNFNIMITNSN